MRLRGDRVACGDYLLFLFRHAGGFGAFGATYCLWLLMENNAPAALHKAAGKTMAPTRGAYMLFVSHNPPSALTQSSETTQSSLTPPRAEHDWWGSPRRGRYRANQQYVAPQAPNHPHGKTKKKHVVAAGDPVSPPTMCSAAGALFSISSHKQYVAPKAPNPPAWQNKKSM